VGNINVCYDDTGSKLCPVGWFAASDI